MTQYFSLQLNLASLDYDHLQAFLCVGIFIHWKNLVDKNLLNTTTRGGYTFSSITSLFKSPHTCNSRCLPLFKK